MRIGWALPVAVLVAPAACTFPDVDYADGDAGSCPGLATCTASAMQCAAAAQSVNSTCVAQCHTGAGCPKMCASTLAAALMSCDATCTGCVPGGCAGTADACKAATGQ